MRLSSRSTGPSRRRRRYNSFGWRERERERERGKGSNQSTGRCRSFWRDEPPFQLFSLDIPTYLPPNVPFCQEGRRGRSCLLERNQVVGSWINRATRVIIRFTDSAPPPRDEIQVFRYRVVSIVSIPLRFDNFSRGTVSFLFFLAFRRDKASYRIEGRCDEFVFLLFSLFFFYLSKRRNEKLGIIFHIIRNFLDRIVVDAILFTMIEDSILIILRLVQTSGTWTMDV